MVPFTQWIELATNYTCWLYLLDNEQLSMDIDFVWITIGTMRFIYIEYDRFKKLYKLYFLELPHQFIFFFIYLFCNSVIIILSA